MPAKGMYGSQRITSHHMQKTRHVQPQRRTVSIKRILGGDATKQKAWKDCNGNQRGGIKGIACLVKRNTTRCQVTQGQQVSYDLPKAPNFVPEGDWKVLEGQGITAPLGFQACGIQANLRSGDRPDLALVYCSNGATAAGVFTKNVMCAAPVKYCMDVLEQSSSKISSILINAGQANAATGVAGWEDALKSASVLSKELNVSTSSILLESTGVIGQRIKMENLLESLPKLVKCLSESDSSAEDASIAITTTDLVSKSTAISFDLNGHTVTIGGMCKGSGMIHPNMATMLGVITCDAMIEEDLWQSMLRKATAQSFNQISVDGDTSTNDTVIALASGQVPLHIRDANSDEAKKLQMALTAVCQGLCKSIAWDGEGANVLLEVSVTGASEDDDASQIAKSIVSSSLTKSAIFGQDPNWGRIACAAGYSGSQFDINMLDIDLGDIKLMKHGQPLTFDRDAASEYLKAEKDKRGTVHINVKVGDGVGEGVAWGCDLSYDYVRINAEYTT